MSASPKRGIRSTVSSSKPINTTATITALAGFTNTLTDNAFNNADTYGDPTEDGGNGQNAAYAESAVIKGKSYSNLTLNGAGTLNLFCATKYSGYDPEVDTRRATPLTPGVDYSAYPKSIGFVAGLNLTF